MFNIFRKKPILADLIPEGFVDIHSHILPGIDDGAKDINESLSLISQMKEMKFCKIIGTPHTYQGLYDNTNENIKGSYDLLKKSLKDDIEIDYASEYMIDGSLLKRIEEKSLLTLKDNYVLVEMSFFSAPLNLYEIVFQILTNGYRPIIAHPERYAFFYKNFDEFYKLKTIGCEFQLNILSTVGYYGRQIVEISDRLLKSRLIDFVGTDIHSQKHIDYMKNKIEIKEIKSFIEAMESNKRFQ